MFLPSDAAQGKPEITKSLSGYCFSFKEEKLIVNVSHVRSNTDGNLTGEIKLILGKSKQEEPAFNHNFKSSSTRKQLVKSLDEKYPDWKWLPIIDEITRQVQSLEKGGEGWSVIQPTVKGVKHPGYYIEPVIMKGVPNVIYGDKGVNKTTLLLTMLGLISVGVDDSETGLIATTQAKVALLDWENNEELTDYTTSRLVESKTLPYFELPYMRCHHPFVDDLERVANFIEANKPEVIGIDSLGKAAGSDKFDSSGKMAALRFFECLDQFKVTSVIIGQNSKNEEGKKTIFGSTYYTYYSRNIFRLQSGRDEISKDEKVIALIHEEGNYSGKYDPIAFRLTFTPTTIKIVREDASLSQFSDRVSLTRDLLEFLKSGQKSVKAISDELGLSDNRVRTLLSQLKRRKLVIKLGMGIWGLLETQENLVGKEV